MPNIVAGRFEQEEDAAAAIIVLQRHGFPRDRLTFFFLNPPGQHAAFPIGGDRGASPGAKSAGFGAAAGAAAGGAVGIGVGLAAAPFLGPGAVPAGAGAGAYIGALTGALAKMEDPAAESQAGRDAAVGVHRAGLIVAVYAPETRQRESACEVLRTVGAVGIEVAEGHWRDGKWVDFDPLTSLNADAT
jgi:hypothetical protein